MTTEEFKQKYPHLAHLEGNELWDAMVAAICKEQEPFIKQEGDDEIVATEKIGEYIFHLTKGAKRAWDEFMKDWTPPKFENYAVFIPDGAHKNDDGSEMQAGDIPKVEWDNPDK